MPVKDYRRTRLFLLPINCDEALKESYDGNDVLDKAYVHERKESEAINSGREGGVWIFE